MDTPSENDTQPSGKFKLEAEFKVSSHALGSTFFEHSLDVICVVEGEYFKDVNPAFLNILGWSKEEFLKIPYLSLLHPDDVIPATEALQRLCKGEKLEGFEDRLRSTDGKYHWFRWSSITFINETTILAFGRDVTQEKIQVQRLLLYKQMVAGIPDRVSYVDENWVYRMVNNAYIFGHWKSEDEVIGKKAWDVVGYDNYMAVRPYFERCLNGETVVFEIPFEIDGSMRYMHVTYTPHPFEDGTRGVVVVGRDITEKKLYERALIESRNRAHAANEAKDRFMAMMSHELRTPLNTIIGLSDLLLEDVQESQLRECLEMISSSGKHQLSLIEDLLDFCKIDSGKLSLEILNVSLREILDTIVRVHMDSARRKGLHFVYEIPDNLPEQFSTDPTRLKQILHNLLINAIKFTAEGEIGLRITHTDNHIQFIIHDTGVGIPEEKHELIFEAFMQAGSSITRKFGGTGLGLSISRNLAEMLGGSLTVSSQIGQGSVFMLTLPKDLELTPHNGDGALIHLNFKSIPNQDVLLVEDDSKNQVTTSLILTRMNQSVAIAPDGVTALAMVKKHKYDLVLMDIQLPDIDGFEVTRRIRNMHLAHEQPRIVALTAQALQGDREACLNAGMDDYLAKPFSKRELHRVLLPSA